MAGERALRDKLVGVWSLLEWTIELPSGAAAAPFGSQPLGKLAYTDSGTVHVHFAQAGRTRSGIPPEQLQDARRASLGLQSAAGADQNPFHAFLFGSAIKFNAYVGNYRVVGSRVYHQVEIALFPDWEGTELARDVEIAGDLLTLTSLAQEYRDTLVWRRC